MIVEQRVGDLFRRPDQPGRIALRAGDPRDARPEPLAEAGALRRRLEQPLRAGVRRAMAGDGEAVRLAARAGALGDVVGALPGVLERPCRFRDAALAALDADGRPYRMLETPSLSALRAAVQGGIGLTCRTDILMVADATIDDPRLPALPRVAYVLRQAENSHPVIGHLRDLIGRAVLSPSTEPHERAALAAAA